jgi:hypothetical protein
MPSNALSDRLLIAASLGTLPAIPTTSVCHMDLSLSGG